MDQLGRSRSLRIRIFRLLTSGLVVVSVCGVTVTDEPAAKVDPENPLPAVKPVSLQPDVTNKPNASRSAGTKPAPPKGPAVDKSKLPGAPPQNGDKKSDDKKTSSLKGPAKARGPVRDPQPLVDRIDRRWSAALAAAELEPSPPADDAEFLRRVTLDLTGIVPSYHETLAYLADTSPDKRRTLVDHLLASQAFGRHFGRAWKRLIQPPDYTSAKNSVDRVTPWLAEQFDSERPWNEVVTDLLTVEASIVHDPRGVFYVANSEMTKPSPSLLAGATGRIFLGVQIGCAECHHHPFAPWKQEDFWGLAACFGRLRHTSKNSNQLTEAPSDDAPPAREVTIVVPEGAGKAVGTVVPARFLDRTTTPDGTGSVRGQLASWITARDNPFFAKAQVNRFWARMFGRGIVDPVDDFREENPPTWPELLDELAGEFTASGYDVKHILRAICLSRAYATTSMPTEQNTADDRLLSHMRVKVLDPDMLYDSLHVVLNSDPAARVVVKGTKPIKSPSHREPVVIEPRDRFVRFFGRAALGDDSLQYGYGIPQMLRLLNSREWNVLPPFVADLNSAAVEPRTAVETLTLAVLARRPTAAEIDRLLSLANTTSSPDYGPAFWVLLNSSEFVVNR